MPGDQPLSIMIKPLDKDASAIDRERRLRRISRAYGIERLHSTVLPLWDQRDNSPARFALLLEALAAIDAEPFGVVFDTLKDNALVGAAATRGLRSFRTLLVQHLTAHSVPVPRYKSRPHLSLAYGSPSKRTVPIEPIGWQVEEFLLIRSIHGEGRHEELGRWPLIPRQHAFDFD